MMAGNWRSRATPVKVDIQPEDAPPEAAPKSDWRSRAKPVVPPAEPLTLAEGGDPMRIAREEAKHRPPPQSTWDFVKSRVKALGDPQTYLEAGDAAATNTINGIPVVGPALRLAAPYVGAAIDKVNPNAPPADYSELVDRNRSNWERLTDPALTAAASVGPNMLMGSVNASTLGRLFDPKYTQLLDPKYALTGLASPGTSSFLADMGVNAVQTADAMDRAGKDLSSPDNIVEGSQTATLMTTAPRVASYGLSKAADSARETLETAAQKAKTYAYEKAVKAVAKGNNLNDMIGPRNLPPSVQRERILENGKYLLEEPQPALKGEPLMKPLQTRGGLAERMETVQRAAGERLGAIKDRINSGNPADVIPKGEMADRAEAELLSQFKPGMGQSGANDYVKRWIDKTFRQRGTPVYELKDLENLKSNIQSLADQKGAFTREVGETPQTLAEIGTWVKNVGEDQANYLVDKYLPELKGEFEAAKQAYSKIAGPTKAIAKELGRDVRNNDIGLGATILGAAQAGDAEGTIGKLISQGKGAAIADFLRNHLPRGTATGLHSTGKALDFMAGEVPDPNLLVNPAMRGLGPERVAAFLQWLKAKNPEPAE